MIPAVVLQLALAQEVAPEKEAAAGGAAWYVAPDGNDLSAGTIDRPFQSLARAQQAVKPGGIVLLRGGTYRLRESDIASSQGIFARIIVLDKSGTEGRPIRYRAMPGEIPILDCSEVKPAGQRVSALYVSGSWLEIAGIEITGVQVTMTGHTQSICVESQGSHNRFERLSLHDGQAIGVYHVRGKDNLFLDCDAWNNWDHTSEGGRGGSVDGFGCHPTKGSTGNVFRGCRAWFNSDDGYDCINAHESVTFENCWATYSGLSKEGKNLADGNGFKIGGFGSLDASRLPDPMPRHVVRGCIASRNKASGFYANHHPGGHDWLDNRAYRNGTNFNMLCRLADNRTDIDGFGHKLAGNLGHGTKRDLVNIDLAECQLSGNSFNLGLPFTDQDFESLDVDELLTPRQQDGSLPQARFMQPVPRSELAKRLQESKP
ncbi:MAG: pectate lyase [Planctomyces sp.]|nr:pectate lyase [Planctomyces sp.]